uniref:Zgc:113425 n=1 Tax=Callorhinchus milii TaxID=7868 RepID=A0A4W3JXI0_CALMI
MDRYRYFIFNQRGMFVLGILQIVCATVCVVSGFVDSTFRKDSILSRTRAPVWAGTFMGLPGVLALFSSQKRNPVLVNSMIGSGVISWFTTTIVILYAALTLNYGEDDDEVFHRNIIAALFVLQEYILSKLVQGANMAILISSVFGLMIATVIAYLGCRSLPNCACYDSTTGMASRILCVLVSLYMCTATVFCPPNTRSIQYINIFCEAL